MYCTANITSTYHKNAGLEAASELLSHTLGHTISSSVTGSTSHRSVWSTAKWASLCAGSLHWSGVGLLYRPRWGCVQSRPSARPSAAVDDSLTPSQRPDYCYTVAHNTYSHTHTYRLMAICPWLPRWAGTRKVKPIWILLKQETVSGSGISWAICKSAPHSRQIATPTPHRSVFYRPDALPAAQPTVWKHWRQTKHNIHNTYSHNIIMTTLLIQHRIYQLPYN